MSLTLLALIVAFIAAVVGVILRNWFVVGVATCIAIGALLVGQFGIR